MRQKDLDLIRRDLESSIRHAYALLAAYETLQRQQAKTIDLLRTVSDNPATENARCSGRTARLILRGLVALSAGKNVLVVGLTEQQALSLKLDLERHARKWKIPFDGDGYGKPDPLPYVRAFTPDTDRTGLRGVTLVDHSVIERMEAAAGVEAGGEVPVEVF